MSTTRDGDETTATLSSISSLRSRLSTAFFVSHQFDNHGNQSPVQLLGYCRDNLERWLAEHVGRLPEGRKFRDTAARNEEKARSIRERIDDASALMLHCEYQLGIVQSSVHHSEQVTKETIRHDCFTALRWSLNELQQPSSPQDFRITASIANLPPPSSSSNTANSPPAPSPRVASSMSPTTSAHASPASHGELALGETPVHVKQEQQVDAMDVDVQERSHFRKDSHLGSQSTPKEQISDTLPPIQYSSAPSLAQIPSIGPYGPILPSHSAHSPSVNSATSVRSSYQTGVINGNDQQTVMMNPTGVMSPNIQYPTLHPPLTLGPHPTNFSAASVFHDHWSPSRPNGSPPET